MNPIHYKRERIMGDKGGKKDKEKLKKINMELSQLSLKFGNFMGI